jgi:molybdopterin/thiamine biosynthesis adenylyltransferase
MRPSINDPDEVLNILDRLDIVFLVVAFRLELSLPLLDLSFGRRILRGVIVVQTGARL